MVNVEKLRENAIRSATYDSLLQICLRLISFIVNAFIVRHTSSAVFAVMTVRLHLLYASGLLLSREAFRRAAFSNKPSILIRKLINLVWLGPLFSIPMSLLGYLVWCYAMEPPPKEVTEDYYHGVFFLSISVFIEVVAEVPFVLSELHLWAKTKVVIEGSMQLSRCLLLALGIFMWPKRAVLVYGITHVIGSLLYLGFFYSLYWIVLRKKDPSSKLLIRNFRDLFPSFKSNSLQNEIDPELWSVSWSFFKQGWLKEALTEGEFYMMNFFPLISLSQQGIYQVVNNLGSLAARLVFRSVESAAYKFFAQTLQRGESIKYQMEKTDSKMKEVSKMLQSLLSNLVLVSLVIVVFGWSYSRMLLKLYGGSDLSELGTHLLKAQSVYVVFLALNGVTEAYTFAAMSDKELEMHNRSLIMFSAVYVAMCLICTQLFGALGFILANCVNMLLRIVHSLIYIKNHFKATSLAPLDSLKLSKFVLSAFLCCWIVTASSELTLYPIHAFLHVLVGAASLLGLIYFLRWEVKSLLDAGLRVGDSILRKLVKKGDANNLYFNYFVNEVHRYLFIKESKKRN